MMTLGEVLFPQVPAFNPSPQTSDSYKYLIPILHKKTEAKRVERPPQSNTIRNG